MKCAFKKLVVAMGIAGALCAAGFANAGEVIKIGIQNGIGYIPFHYLSTPDGQELVAKRAKEEGVDAKIEIVNLGTPGIITDALLSDQVQSGVVGIPSVANLYVKTKGSKDIKMVSGVVSLPMFMNTNDPAIKDACDLLKTNGKVALPTARSSVQSVTLAMYAAKTPACGSSATAFATKEVSMQHPDAMSSLLSGKGEVTAHFTSPPFQYAELEEGKGKVRTVLNSYDVLGGKTSFIALVANGKWAAANPKLYNVLYKSTEDAVRFVNENRSKAVSVYMSVEKPKEDAKDVLAQITSKDVEFSTTPRHVQTYSDFMFGMGMLKIKPTWKDMSFPNLHDKAGS